MTSDVRRLSLPDPEALALQISAGRSAVAAVVLAAPVVSARVMGTETATAQRVTWLVRMLGARDGALGVGGAVAIRRGGSDAIPWLLGGAVADAVDALVIAGAVKQGRLKGIFPAAIVPIAALTAVAGVVTAAGLRRRA
jgi:hypothetical protein